MKNIFTLLVPSKSIVFLALLMLGIVAPVGAAEGVSIISGADGAKHFAINGKEFVPIGVNYLVTHSGAPYQTFDMFDTKTFDLAAIGQNLDLISKDGFTYVRLWLKGLDPDDGFNSEPYKISDAYVENVAATIHKAQQAGLHVVLTGGFRQGVWLPKNYLPGGSLPPDEKIGGMNRLILLPEMAAATGQFYHDLLVKLKEKDPKILSSIFYFDFYNELQFDMSQPPFSSSSGQYEFEGRTFDLGQGASRQALMDAAGQSWFRVVKEKVKPVAPEMLVTSSSFYIAAFGHSKFDGGIHSKAAPYPLRPSVLVSGGADLIDIHTYPSPQTSGLPAFHERAAQLLGSNEITEITGLHVPLIAGEFGAYKSKYPQPGDAPIELLAATDALCKFHFVGFGVWMWNGSGDTWTLSDEPLLKALAPKYHPQFCGQMVQH